MTIKPNELANVCAIFPSLRTRYIAQQDLEGYVQKGLSLDATSSPREIVKACVTSKLISESGSSYTLMDTGKKLAKCHNEVSPLLSESTKLCILRDVYLNPDLGKACCQPFILLFRVDSIRGTFVYDRVEDESPDNLLWMQLLESVGFIDVTAEIALVRPYHLEYMNEFLHKIRSTTLSTEKEARNYQKEVGDIAEQKAVEYEKKRLILAGYSELVCLVQRISLIDWTAGFDIVSCLGLGKKPEIPIYIEVKGTRKSEVCFLWSQNERTVAERMKGDYWIYVYTDIDLRTKNAKGPIRIRNPYQRLERLGYALKPLDVYVFK